LAELKRWTVEKKGTTRGDRTLKRYLNDEGRVRFRDAMEALRQFHRDTGFSDDVEVECI
jgi:hypothetical protein